MRIDPDTCTDPVLLAAEVRRLRAVIASGDCPEEDNAAEQDNDDRSQPIAKRDATPDADDTPGECTVSPQCTEDGEK
jgi:hypothetical protein